MCTAVLIDWDPATPSLPPHWDSVLRGRYWSPKIDDISLWPPGGTVPEEEEGGPGGQTAGDHALWQRLQQDRVRTHRRPQLGPPVKKKRIVVPKFATRWQGETSFTLQIRHEVTGWNEYLLTNSPRGGRVKRILVHKFATRWHVVKRILVHKFATRWHGAKRILVHKFATRWQGETNISSQTRHKVAGWNEY